MTLLLIWGNTSLAAGDDDPLVSKLIIDQLELRDTDEDETWVLDAQGWVGKDLHKLWFKVDAERSEGNSQELELQALYNKAIAPYWDFQLGLRKDLKPSPSRSWAVIGIQGLAPYYFEIDSALFIGESGRAALRLEAEYELLFTQRLILSPEIELNLHAQNDAEHGIGSGLSDIEAGLRLRYEIRREFAPYMGIYWTKRFGNTADFARQEGLDSSEWQWVIGIRSWF
ncbi:copper resistance protein B [Parahaliea sp. F7430]|uniref:Copper resistance protein B n=1 Tax=Sediminihaliea albiluteola TaxID=2758564 RepID=A0A7W2TUA6_9GAMM|nr:copper resistance protein B [Sediminihaliea albiluteola]MBA6412081.1 copper resistance protein B [Sediminihaliea albiluteola]